MKKALLIISLAIATGSISQAALIAGWDFQTTSNGGTAAAAAPNSPFVYIANVGSGTLYLDGTHGSSTWTSSASSPEVTAFTGTGVNATNGLDATTSTTSSLTLANSTANDKSIVFTLDMSSYTDLYVSYATQSSASGFNLQTWSYSLDGTNYVDFATYVPRTTASTTFAGNGIVAFDALSALAGVSTAYIKVTFTGATSASGNNRLDNVQFTTTPVPEPGAVALFALGFSVAIFTARRRFV